MQPPVTWAAFTLLVHGAAGDLGSCSVDADTCRYTEYIRDGECDNAEYGGEFNLCKGECSDIFDCRVAMEGKASCSDCVAAGGVWCAPATLCLQLIPDEVHAQNWMLAGDFQLCSTSFWVSTCQGTIDSFFADPAYEAQSWVYKMINLESVWADGYTGAGVQIAINDVGIDIDHPDLSDKFTEKGSCVGRDVGSTDDLGHGTACAAIAMGAANHECSVGVAPNATLAGCPLLGKVDGITLEAISSTPFRELITYRSDLNDISSNSWNYDSCFLLDEEGRRRLTRRKMLKACPFVADAELSPCQAVECLDEDTGKWAAAQARTSNCQAKIKEYCAEERVVWYDTPHDVGCKDWFHVQVTCDYNDLEPRDVLALNHAIKEGRGGKGQIIIFASGNEHLIGEDVGFEGWLFTRETIAVGSVGKQGRHSSFSTAGAALLVSAPGGDNEYSHGHFVAMPGNSCGDVGVGTSYAAPVVTGVVALMLEANPELTWMDVQGILVTTSQNMDPDDSSWVTNAAGLFHSYKYGFGVVDAREAVEAAQTWVSYGEERLVTSDSAQIDATIPADGMVLMAELTVVLPAKPSFEITTVYVYLHVSHASRGDMHVELVSPAGTRSVLVPGPRPASDSRDSVIGTCNATNDDCIFKDDGFCDANDGSFCLCDFIDCIKQETEPYSGWPFEYGPALWNWRMASVRTWGEDPVGTWRLEVADKRAGSAVEMAQLLGTWSLYIYGHDQVGPAATPIAMERAQLSHKGNAKKAIDGNLDSFVKVKKKDGPWFSARVPKGKTIGMVHVYNRACNKRCQKKLIGYEVWIGRKPGDTSSSLAVKCGGPYMNLASGLGPFATACTSSNKRQRHVTVLLPGQRKTLQLSEVTVYEEVK